MVLRSVVLFLGLAWPLVGCAPVGWYCWDAGVPFPHREEQPAFDHACSAYELANNPHP